MCFVECITLYVGYLLHDSSLSFWVGERHQLCLPQLWILYGYKHTNTSILYTQYSAQFINSIMQSVVYHYSKTGLAYTGLWDMIQTQMLGSALWGVAKILKVASRIHKHDLTQEVSLHPNFLRDNNWTCTHRLSTDPYRKRIFYCLPRVTAFYMH